MEWFRDDTLGIFIQWGASSLRDIQKILVKKFRGEGDADIIFREGQVVLDARWAVDDTHSADLGFSSLWPNVLSRETVKAARSSNLQPRLSAPGKPVRAGRRDP